jgi:uncharacterized protein (TIGR00251 family)
MEIEKYIINRTLRVIVKPNSSNTEIVGWDENKKMLRIAVAAVPDKNKANAELLKFIRKETGKKCELVRGPKSREKVVEFV